MNYEISVQIIAKMIDHSLLHPTMTDKQIIEGCELAKQKQYERLVYEV